MQGLASTLAIEPALVAVDVLFNQWNDHFYNALQERAWDSFVRDIVFGIAQRITVFDQGRTLADGTPAQISADERVRAAYLGESA